MSRSLCVTLFVLFAGGSDADRTQVSYAKQNGRALIVGSGRHGWGMSLKDVRDAIMVDITPLSAIVIDSATNTLTIGGGVTIGHVNKALHAAGKETRLVPAPPVHEDG